MPASVSCWVSRRPMLDSPLRVFEVDSGIGIVGDLVVVAAGRGDEAKLVGGIDVVDEGAEAAEAVDGIVHDLGDGRLQSEIAAVAVEAGVVGEALVWLPKLSWSSVW